MKQTLVLQYPAVVLAEQLISAAVDWFARSPALRPRAHEAEKERQRALEYVERCRAGAHVGQWI